MKFKSIKGFHDILPEKTTRWQFVENNAREVFSLYGFKEIRIPILEYTDIYQTGIGDTTDIVSKEMYTFEDRDESLITLRPEGTAGVVRSFIENSLHKKSPINKLYYIGSMFRHERPQKGRYRGFNQIGAELFGSNSPASDAEIISMLWQFFTNLGFKNSFQLEINSIGDSESRENFKKVLIEYLSPKKEELCSECQRRLDTNPLRIIDCKKENCKKAISNGPNILEHLTPQSKEHFNSLMAILFDLNIPFKINNQIVRGLDYYSETVFELTTNLLGSQNAVAAGGRYNNLVEKFGGPITPAIGFAIGVERVVMLHEEIYSEDFTPKLDIYIAWIGDLAFSKSCTVAKFLREKNLSVEMEYESKSLKSQLKRANKLNAENTIIIGEEEIKNNVLKLRNMLSSTEIELKSDRPEELISKLKQD